MGSKRREHKVSTVSHQLRDPPFYSVQESPADIRHVRRTRTTPRTPMDRPQGDPSQSRHRHRRRQKCRFPWVNDSSTDHPTIVEGTGPSVREGVITGNDEVKAQDEAREVLSPATFITPPTSHPPLSRCRSRAFLRVPTDILTSLSALHAFCSSLFLENTVAKKLGLFFSGSRQPH